MKALQVAGQVLICIAMIPFIPLIIVGLVLFMRSMHSEGYL